MVVPRLILFARYPQAGAAKTRLIPLLGADGAAAVHRKLTERTMALLQATNCPVEMHYTGAGVHRFKQWLGSDAKFVPQPDGDLGARLRAALRPGPCIFFGADTPDLTASHVEAAIVALQDHDGIIGPAVDGGYYLIGLRHAHPAIFENIDWSTERVFSQTMAKVRALNLDFAILDTLSDCDRPEDLARWPWLVA